MAVVSITGCSSGFGLAATTAFAARGDQVIATMRDLNRRAELDRATAAHQELVDVMQLDVTDAKSRTMASCRQRPQRRRDAGRQARR